MRFKELGPPRRLLQIRLHDRKDEGEWCEVTGWTSEAEAQTCPAYAVPIEDSGAGMAYLVYGGNCGIRFKPTEIHEEWDLHSTHQWGEPYLVLASAQDLGHQENREEEKE